VQWRLTRIATAALVGWAAVIVAMVTVLAVVHADDRYGVGAASGVWMGLAAAAHDGVWYPPVYAQGFFGGTRYMPLPIVLQLGGRLVSGEYLVSAKLLIYLVNGALYTLVYRAARRQGSPAPIALAMVATILTSSAATTTVLGLRWDALATLCQLGAIELMSRSTTTRPTVAAGVLCGLAITTKVTSLWAPAAIAVWLARKPRSLATFAGSLVATSGVIVAAVDALSHGRMLRQLHDFTFAGSTHATLADGLHRFYQLGLRNQRELPLLLALAIVALGVAVVRRRAGLLELGLVFAVPIVIVVMRDTGAYENHLLDLEILAGLAVAGLWRSTNVVRRPIVQDAVVGVLVLASIAAAHYTLIPDARAAASHELRGRGDARYTLHPVPALVAQGSCALFEDASIPILAGQRPLVLDAFIAHRLQTTDPVALSHLLRGVDTSGFRTIALNFPLTNLGWFETLDFGSAFAHAVDTHYRLTQSIPKAGLFVYTPRRAPRRARACPTAGLGDWH
jgi:hypothetical protein